jgi:demethylmenaquinone methyltransferase/2-methoxy-6-polyprenyl-1,4-benzoquinol methylase
LKVYFHLLNQVAVESSKPLSRNSIQHFYDRAAGFYRWFSIFESEAKNTAVENLDLAPGQKLLNVGLGTGSEQQDFLKCLLPGGTVIGIDLSFRMLQVASLTSKGFLCQGDARDLPLSTGVFDRIYCAFVLDLVLDADLPAWLAGFRRVLKPGGRIVMLSLVEGVNLPSKILVSAWKQLYRIDPRICGGCRPLELTRWAASAGFECIERRVIVQLGLPSEVVVAV